MKKRKHDKSDDVTMFLDDRDMDIKVPKVVFNEESVVTRKKNDSKK